MVKVWDETDRTDRLQNYGGYTDQVWRAECEAKARELAEERVTQREYEMAQEGNRKATNALRRANQTQIGGDHYKNMGVEPWDVVDTWPIEQRIGAYRHGVIKYTMRMGTKDENIQELEKGLHYMEKLIEVLKEERDNDKL